jgi:hypothetical protein
MLTDFAENRILDAVFGRRVWSNKPTTLHLSAWTVGPDDAGTGGTEVSGGGYGRKAVAVNTVEWSEATDAFNVGITNVNQISWNMATAAWGTITHIGFHTAASGGQLIAVIALAAPIDISAFNVLKAEPSALSFRMAGNVGNFMACAILNYLFRGAALPAIPTFFVGLGMGLSATDLQSELSANNYDRRALPNSTGNWPVAFNGGKSLVLAANLDFATASAAWGNPTHYGLFSTPLQFTTVTPNTSDDVLAATAHGFQNDDELFMVAGTFPTTSPAGDLAPNLPIYVVNRTANNFQVSRTLGGAPINMTAIGATVRVRRSSLNGNLLWGGQLDNALTIASSDKVILTTGSIQVSLE